MDGPPSHNRDFPKSGDRPVTMAASGASRQKSPAGHEHSRSAGGYGKSTFSLAVLIAALLMFILAMALSRSSAEPAIAGLLFLLIIPCVITSLVLAILGFRQSSHHPARYPSSRHGGLRVDR